MSQSYVCRLIIVFASRRPRQNDLLIYVQSFPDIKRRMIEIHILTFLSYLNSLKWYFHWKIWVVSAYFEARQIIDNF